MIFASDNWAGASPKVIDALAEAARSGHPAYGADDITKAVERRFSDLFEREVTVFLVASGTVANALALSAYARPGGVVFCHRHAHIVVDEAGATSFFGGGITLTPLGGDGGKFVPASLTAGLDQMKDHVPHSGQAIAVSVTELTELGAAYRPDEVRAIAEVANAHGCAVHMDGARFSNAVAALGCSPADITWRAGVDVLSFGGTKNGCMAAEAVVFFDQAPVRDALFQRQRAGQGFSKNWFIASQFDAYLKDNHWLRWPATPMAWRRGWRRPSLRPATGGWRSRPTATRSSRSCRRRPTSGSGPRARSIIRGRLRPCRRMRSRDRTRSPSASSAAGRRAPTRWIVSQRCWREGSAAPIGSTVTAGVGASGPFVPAREPRMRSPGGNSGPAVH
jgi:threonine aldolase